MPIKSGRSFVRHETVRLKAPNATVWIDMRPVGNRLERSDSPGKTHGPGTEEQRSPDECRVSIIRLRHSFILVKDINLRKRASNACSVVVRKAPPVLPRDEV